MSYEDWLAINKIKQAEDLNHSLSFEPFLISPYPNPNKIKKIPFILPNSLNFAVGESFLNHSVEQIKASLNLGLGALDFKAKYSPKDLSFIDFSLVRSFFAKDSWYKDHAANYTNQKEAIFFLPHEIAEDRACYSAGFSAETEVLKGANKTIELAVILHELNSFFKTKSTSALYIRLFNDNDFFLDIAKVRALRFLFQALCNEHGIKNLKPYIHIEFHPQYYLYNDPKMNLLRQSSALFSALNANAQSFSCFDYAFRHEPTKESLRLVKTMQYLLKEESYLDEVIDPSRGSYFIEDLSYKLANASWDLFLALDSGKADLDSMLKDLRQKRQQAIKDKTKTLLGFNYLAADNFKQIDSHFLDGEVKL